jgi:hypothetical protein
VTLSAVIELLNWKMRGSPRKFALLSSGARPLTRQAGRDSEQRDARIPHLESNLVLLF